MFRDPSPGLGRIIWWVILGNLAVVSITVVAFGLVPWLSGDKPTMDATALVVTGAVAVAVVFAVVFVLARRNMRMEPGQADGRIRFGDRVELISHQTGKIVGACDEASLRALPRHAYEKVDGQEYYIGPALTFEFEGREIIVAVLDSSIQWEYDPPAVGEIDWLCSKNGWTKLTETLEMSEQITPYDPGDWSGGHAS